MVVLSNHRLGPGAELLVSRETAGELLRQVARAAAPAAEARWEHELVSWLERCASCATALDASDIAWTPEHFERQRSFLVGAIRLAAHSSAHAGVLDRWCALIEAYPRDSVSFGRRWQWPSPLSSGHTNS